MNPDLTLMDVTEIRIEKFSGGGIPECPAKYAGYRLKLIGVDGEVGTISLYAVGSNYPELNFKV